MSVPVTSKGQVTIPVEVRKLLGIAAPGRVTFAVSENGEVTLRAPRFPTIDSLRGIAGALECDLSWEEMLQVARHDALADKAHLH
jgi:AbrB family looped-hinge helix DNA binding protein